jgi:hypothetical protein
MNPTDRQDGHDLSAERAEGSSTDARARERLDRRAEALRSNLKRRKAQSRGRAEAERSGRSD